MVAPLSLPSSPKKQSKDDGEIGSNEIRMTCEGEVASFTSKRRTSHVRSATRGEKLMSLLSPKLSSSAFGRRSSRADMEDEIEGGTTLMRKVSSGAFLKKSKYAEKILSVEGQSR